MKRELGICSWTFGPIDFEEKCRLIAYLGVDGIEIEGDINILPEEVNKTLNKYNLKVFSVTPKDMDISSCDERVRKEAIDYYLKLLPWSKKVNAERISIHGEVGRYKGTVDLKTHWNLLLNSVNQIAEAAEKYNILVVYEVLNRYENYQILTCSEAKELLQSLNSDRVKILLDAYHMNIEESNPVEALRLAGKDLGLYHLADSNRQGIGFGHTDVASQLKTLEDINYTGPIVMEMTAEGSNPYTPVKNGNYLDVLTDYYRNSIKFIKVH